LLNAKDKLITMLKREERYTLAQECFQAVPTIVQLDLLQYKDIFEH